MNGFRRPILHAHNVSVIILQEMYRRKTPNYGPWTQRATSDIQNKTHCRYFPLLWLQPWRKYVEVDTPSELLPINLFLEKKLKQAAEKREEAKVQIRIECEQDYTW